MGSQRHRMSGRFRGFPCGCSRPAARVCLIATVILAHCAAGALAQNLLTNGDFESGSNGWIPVATDSGVSVMIDPAVSFSGGASARLDVSHPSVVTAGWAQGVSLLAGHVYLFEYAVRTSNVDMMAYPFLDFAQGGVTQATSFATVVGGTSPWEVHRYRFRVPAGVDGVTLIFLLWARSGTAWFDAATLTEMTDTTSAALSVDLTSTGGSIRRYAGTNAGPVWPGNPNDMTPQFAQMGIDGARVHDMYGPGDMDQMFPDPLADPALASSYHFSGTDSVIAAMVGAGATPLFRLGRSFGAPGTPPPDASVFAQACMHVVMHYNEGWASGYTYNIKDWEIWNEPDLNELWTGTDEEYAHLYTVVSRVLKAHDPTLRVGGPAVANIWNRRFVQTFFDTVIARSSPIDFFSYHVYAPGNPRDFARADSVVASMLAARGFGSLPRYMTEWNTYHYDAANVVFWGRDDALNAASTAAAITYLQTSGPSRAYRYRTDEYFFPLVRDDGSFSYGGNVFRAVATFASTPVLLTATGGDDAGRTVLAARSTDGLDVNVLIADNSSPAKGYTLSVGPVPAGEVWSYTVSRIDSLHEYVTVDSGVVSFSQPAISQTVSAPFVDHIALRKTVASGAVPGAAGWTLRPNYPNPFNPSTAIEYVAPYASHVELAIYDASGARVRTLVDGDVQRGPHVLVWDGRNDRGDRVSTGLYFARLVSGAFSRTVKITLLK